jgi:hypothetical protein
MKIIISESQYNRLLESTDSESILIIGDSHSVDAGFTYSSLIKNKYSDVKIAAVSGKRTSWMVEQLSQELSKKHYKEHLETQKHKDNESGNKIDYSKINDDNNIEYKNSVVENDDSINDHVENHDNVDNGDINKEHENSVVQDDYKLSDNDDDVENYDDMMMT